MKTRTNTKNQGYIALISTIVISLILLALTANMSTAGFYVRFNSLDSEYKRISLGLAESCVHAALLKLAKNNTYAPPAGGEIVSVGSEACTINEVLTDLSDPTKKTVKTQADFSGAFSNMRIETIVQDPLVSPVIPAYIFVIVQVVNDNGGSSSAGDFTVDLTAVNPSASSFPGAETGTLITADAGSFNVSETGPAGYLTTYSADCSGTVAGSETKTCTITNNDVPTTATLTVIANVTNDNSGSLGPGDFPLFIDGVAVSNGVGVTVSPGSHTVTGTGATGYSPSPWGSHCDPGGTITLAAGGSKTCSITYDDIPPATVECADTVMMLDRTGSMGSIGSPERVAENAAAKKLLDLYSGVIPHPQVGVGSLEGIEPGGGSYPPLVPASGRLTNDYGVNTPTPTRLYNLIDTITNMAIAWMGTNIAGAISVGDAELNSVRHNLALKKVLILFSDGVPNTPVEATAPEAARDAADNAKIPHGADGRSTEIFTFYFGSDGIGRNLMAQLATGETSIPSHSGHTGPLHQPGSKNDVTTGSPAEIAAENSDDDNFFTSPSVADMVPIFATIAERICPAVASPPPPPPPTTATLQVITTVINDNGGTKDADEFTMIVSALNPFPPSFPGVAFPGKAVTVDPGSYSVDEGPTGPYTKAIGVGCSGSISAGDTKTCTITNDDTPPPSSPPPPPPPPPPITIESWIEQPTGP